MEDTPQNNMELQQLHRKLDEVQAMQVQILGYLHNNTGTGELGLVADYKAHKIKVEAYITEQNQKEAVTKAKVGVIATIFGFVGAAILKVATMWWGANHT